MNLEQEKAKFFEEMSTRDSLERNLRTTIADAHHAEEHFMNRIKNYKSENEDLMKKNGQLAAENRQLHAVADEARRQEEVRMEGGHFIL